MRLSRGFWQTYKETPAEAQIPSHRLMLRAGLIHKAAAGLYNQLPMGRRSIRKIEDIVRQEMDRAGAFEILACVATPGELWKESGRWEKMGGELLTFQDKSGADLCLSPTNEEAVADIFRKTVKSYKQLPLNLYQINTKFRDELRPRFGLMRAREFVMKDAYSFDIDQKGLEASYQAMYRAYCEVFKRCGLNFVAVEADAGNMASGDAKTHEFQALAKNGEDQIAHCPATNYAAGRDRATTCRPKLQFDRNTDSPELVATPDIDTITKLCDFLKVPPHHTLKAMVYAHRREGAGEGEVDPVLVLLLGDDEVSEAKLQGHLGGHIAAASDEMLAHWELPKGYIGALGLKRPVRLVLDRAVDTTASYTTGASQKNAHYRGIVPERDVKNFEVADVRLAQEGDTTPDGKGVVALKRGIEVGHIFQLGDLYSKALKVGVLDGNGRDTAPLMGCYGIGVTRIIAAVIEQHHDERGIVWPKQVAPYDIHLLLLGKSGAMKEKGEEIYQSLTALGFQVLYDDRDAGAGFKFKDAELLGLPLTVALGEKTFKQSGELEIIQRQNCKKTVAKEAQLAHTVRELYDLAF